MEAFQISLNATTEQQRSKLAKWAQDRTKAHTITTREQTVFASVFTQPADFAKFSRTIARNTKRWGIGHTPYTKWITALTQAEYIATCDEIKPRDRNETIRQELREMSIVPPPDYWDLAKYADAADFLGRVRLGKRPPMLKC